MGLLHSRNQIGAFRPANLDENFKKIFYVGASTIPGAKLSMAIVSSKLAFKRIEKFSNLHFDYFYASRWYCLKIY